MSVTGPNPGGSSPVLSTLRWNRIAANPPSTAPISAARIAAPIAMAPTTVTWPSFTGSPGKVQLGEHVVPDAGDRGDRGDDQGHTHTHTARPCLAPLNGSIHPPTYPPQ